MTKLVGFVGSIAIVIAAWSFGSSVFAMEERVPPTARERDSNDTAQNTHLVSKKTSTESAENIDHSESQNADPRPTTSTQALPQLGISQVTEPRMLTMLLAGLGLMGVIVFRRKKYR